MEVKNKIIYSIQAGLFLAVAFPPFPLFFMAYIGFIPLFFVLKDSYDNKTKSYGNAKYIYITFFIYHVLSNWWISTLQENSDIYLFFAGIALDFIHPLFFLFPFAILYLVKKIVGFEKAVWTFPLIFTFFEYLHSLGDLGYPWLSLAYTQFNNFLWLQILDIQSIYGGTLLICFMNVLIYKLVLQIKRKTPELILEKKLTKHKATNLAIKEVFKIKVNQIYFVLIWMMLVLPIIYGWFRVKEYNFDENMVNNDEHLNVALVQPNINPWKKWENTSMEQVDILYAITDSLLKNDYPIDLVVFPETAIPIINYNVNMDLQLSFFDDILLKNNAALLTGISRIYIYGKDETPDITSKIVGDNFIAHYNSAILYDTKNETQIYDKMRLTPLAERFPFIDYLPFMKDLLVWSVGVSGWAVGEKLETMSLIKNNDTIKIGTIICIESIHPAHIRSLVNKGANILAVITNDSWYDGSYGPFQHNLMSMARAIEHRRYVVRCANSGITCFISPTGKTITKAYQYQAAGISASIPLIDENELTIYAKTGDILPLLCILVCIIYVAVVRIKIG
ncbi:MAG: apolipoprotein N-acyltransferase [Bacteroidetes bacterium]|nr:apolipoprotein N-acyltransferase [Bacteroidota bacterium]